MLIKKVGIKYLILFILVYFLLNIDHAAAQLNDIDNDLLNNQIESLLGTNPAIKDSDQDGLTDAEEFIQGSNPKDADTDDNGISDGEEKITKTGNKFFDDLNDSFQNNSLENEESGFSGNFPQEDKDKNLGTSKTNKKRTSSNSEKTRTKDLNIDENNESYISVFGNGLNLQAKDRCSENLNYQFSCLPDNILKGCVQKCNIGCDINSCRKTIETAKRENVELLGSWGG